MEDCCHPDDKKQKRDYLFLGSLAIVVPSYLIFMIFSVHLREIPELAVFTHSVFELLNKMWFGVLAGMFFAGVMEKIPKEFVISALGGGRGFSGVFRATMAGVLFDLCSHGILLIAAKLYQRGATLGQTMAFLIASPWNSFSLTLVLWSLIGFKWTLCFIVLSMLIAIISGLIFERLVQKKVLPDNPNIAPVPANFYFFDEVFKSLKKQTYNKELFIDIMKNGVKGSKMIVRWLLVGVIIASIIRTFLTMDQFQTFFGPSLFGLFITMVAATIIEVCSEGSTPIAADIMTRALAPGSSFAFLMVGVATDYTEVMVLKEATRSWKIALFLPLVVTPQVFLLGYILNHFAP